jgi:hypothetical protein
MRDRLWLCALAFRLPCDALLLLIDQTMPSDTPIDVRVAHNSGKIPASHRDHVGVFGAQVSLCKEKRTFVPTADSEFIRNGLRKIMNVDPGPKD